MIMQSVIHKQQKPFHGFVEFSLPKGSEILRFDVSDDNETIFVWYRFNISQKEAEFRSFRIVGTGMLLESTYNLDHQETVFTDEFVWHIFEMTKE